MATALFTGVDAGWSATTEIALISLFGLRFGIPALTDAVMASVPVEDAGVGSAVNDVSRELGSALGVAILGSVISASTAATWMPSSLGPFPTKSSMSPSKGLESWP